MTDPPKRKVPSVADILDQIDAVLADVTSCQCGGGQAITDRSPSPWFADENHQARWDRRQVTSGIEEESAPVEAAPPLRLADVAATAFEMRRRTPEERREYFAAERARRVAAGAPEVWLASFDALAGLEDITVIPADQFDDLMATIDEPDDMPALRAIHERRHPTLAEMNEASAAVRARREPLPTATDEELDTALREANERLVAAISEQSPPGSWWRRMLGGGTR